MNMTEIESSCRDLSTARASLRRKFEARQKAINTVAAEHDEDIRRIQAGCSSLRDVLETGVTASRELFAGKRKTQTFFGITVGFRKAADSVEYPPDADLVDRIEKLLPAKVAETLLDRSVSVLKTPLKKLAADVLQKLGIRRVSGADEPVVLANDDDIETLVQKSLGEIKA